MFVCFVHNVFNTTKILDSCTLKDKIVHIKQCPFNGPLSGTTWVSQYQKDKTNLDFTEARDSEWQ